MVLVDCNKEGQHFCIRFAYVKYNAGSFMQRIKKSKANFKVVNWIRTTYIESSVGSSIQRLNKSKHKYLLGYFNGN